jgi:hypothetical protein
VYHSYHYYSPRYDARTTGIALFVLGVSLILDGLRRLRVARRVEDTPRSRAVSAPQGLAELQGYGWAARADGCVACLDGRPAIYRHFEIQRRVSSGRSRYWQTVYEERHNPPFLLVDATAAVIVNAPEAQWEMRQQTIAWEQAGTEVRSRYAAQAPSGVFSTLRLVERRVLQGSPVYARGSFRTPQATLAVRPSPGVSEFWIHVKRLEDPAYRAAMLDQNRDGVVTDQEAESVMAAGSAVWARSAVQRAPEAQPLPMPPLSGVLASDQNHVLLVADCGEDQLVKRLGHGIWMIIGGALLAGLGSAILYQAKSLPFHY